MLLAQAFAKDGRKLCFNIPRRPSRTDSFYRAGPDHRAEDRFNGRGELCPQKWTFGHTKTDTYRFKEQFHRFETVMPETRYVDDVSH